MLTSNVEIKIESKKEREFIHLKLDEVALEPCSVAIEEDGIHIILPEVNRSLIEIIGPGEYV